MLFIILGKTLLLNLQALPGTFLVPVLRLSSLHLKVDFTGGVHTDGDISHALEYGATYITAASVAVSNKSLFASWICTKAGKLEKG